MHSGPLDELYLRWLYEQVAVPEYDDRDLTYWKILKVLYKKEFVWVVANPNDENRIRDGIALRTEFLESRGISDADPVWIELGCSMLELMVGLAKRLEFMAENGKAHYWFWMLMDNIGLIGYNDERRFTGRLIDRIDDILDDVIYRNYEPSGHGGFFPLNKPRHDQRDRELWYQMCDYVLEKELAG
jgi:hypothetical protein